MPIVPSHFHLSFPFNNAHFSTIYSGLIRRVKGVDQQRERLVLSDGDFLDLDWSYAQKPTDKLIIVLHGLEGNANRSYMLGTAQVFNANGFDSVCVNFRGCSGEVNTKYRSYHSGATEDLEEVIQYIVKHKDYAEIFIKGISLGGNVILKYLGEGRLINSAVKAAVAVSVPCDLKGSCIELHKPKNLLYAIRFKAYLIRRLKIKQAQFPDRISSDEIRKIRTLKDFDDAYTSKAHGFHDALDYYKQCSSLQYLNNITIPTLIINAENDTFLSDGCYPYQEAINSDFLFLEVPKYGGHVGFFQRSGIYYNESSALNFIKSYS